MFNTISYYILFMFTQIKLFFFYFSEFLLIETQLFLKYVKEFRMENQNFSFIKLSCFILLNYYNTQLLKIDI